MDLHTPTQSNDTSNFSIKAQSSIFILKQSTFIPLVHQNYEVSNVGQTEVTVELWYGTEIGLIDVVDRAVLQPNTTKVLHDGGYAYFVTELKVENNSDFTAYISANYTNLLGNVKGANTTALVVNMSIDMNEIFRRLCLVALKFIPVTGEGLAAILNLFWPQAERNVWNEIKDNIVKLIDEATLETIQGILAGELKSFKESVVILMKEIKEKRSNRASHYMSLALALTGIEFKFIIGNNDPKYRATNFFLLPLYSTFVHMKICFYMAGILQQGKIGLTNEEVEEVKEYGIKTIQGDEGAIKYITEMAKERLEYAYNTTSANNIYNTLMNVRTFLGVFGLEYIPIWEKLLNQPFSKEHPHTNVITYSTYFGKETVDLIRQATARELEEPLTPDLINNKRNKMVAIEVYEWNFDSIPKVGGIKLFFENGAIYVMGNVTSESKRIDFNDALLNKLVVLGDDTIDGLQFFFSDGRKVNVGTNKLSHKSETFELKQHSIVSMFVSTDNKDVIGKIANLSVSYQLVTGEKQPQSIFIDMEQGSKFKLLESKLANSVKMLPKTCILSIILLMFSICLFVFLLVATYF